MIWSGGRSPTPCRTGQSFFVESKPGAGTVVGRQAAAQSEPHGYTLVVGGLSNMAFNSALYSRLAYEPMQDFVPVAMVYRFGYVIGRPQGSAAGRREGGRSSQPRRKARLDFGCDRRRRHGAGEVWDMPNGLAAFVGAEYANWTTLIREAGIKLD